MIAFIDDHRAIHGVESICRTLQIAPSGYYARLAVRSDPSKASARQQRGAVLRPKTTKVWNDDWQVYGVRKTWRQLCREGEAAARCTVARLMTGMGLRGVVRGKAMKTTIPDTSVPCPRDQVNRVFGAPAPNMLWVSDFSCVSTWQGFVHVAPRHWARTNGAFNGSMIDTFANRIVGWKASRSAKTDFVPDALEQALYARRPAHKGGLIHHSDRGSQYVSIRYTERLGKAGIEPSVGSVGDAYDNALAETINGLDKTEVIRRRSSWKTMDEVELETLKRVDWFNNRRLLEPIGNIPPAEAEEAFYANLITPDMVA
jgi:putative transposase